MTDFEYTIFENLCDNECCVMNTIASFADYNIMRRQLYYIQYEKTIADLSAWKADPHLKLKSCSNIQHPESFMKSTLIYRTNNKIKMFDSVKMTKFSWLGEDEMVQLAKFIARYVYNNLELFNRGSNND